jgi:capsular polysaccharide biosynthesis protein
MMSLLVGFFLAATVSAGVVFTLEYFDPSFRTPTEVEAFLNRPVLAAVPDQQGGFGFILSSADGSDTPFQTPENS